MANVPNSLREAKDRAEQAGATAGRKLGDLADRARDAAAVTAEKAQQGAETVMDKVQGMTSQVTQSVKDAASSVADTAEGAYEATAESLSEFNRDVMKLIHRHPKQAMLICFGAGFLLGAGLLGGLLGSNRT